MKRYLSLSWLLSAFLKFTYDNWRFQLFLVWANDVIVNYNAEIVFQWHPYTEKLITTRDTVTSSSDKHMFEQNVTYIPIDLNIGSTTDIVVGRFSWLAT
jgi:hypothetical protein